MSIQPGLLQPAAEPETAPVSAPQTEAEISPMPAASEAWRVNRLAEEQIRRLVWQVFIPGWPKPARHVVFCAVDPGVYVAEICMDVARELSTQVAGSVCVIEANPQNPALEEIFGRKEKEKRYDDEKDEFNLVRSLCQHVSGNLWLAPRRVLNGEGARAPAWLERRTTDLRLEFDYTLYHAPPAGLSGEAALLGNMSDGVVLVIEANSTRRISAQRAKEMLYSANARVLGAVLSERTFPLPESIYRRL